MTDGAKQKETPAGLASVEAVTQMLAGTGYIATPEIATAVYLAHHLRKPVLIEGPAGVGKTDLARSVAIGHLVEDADSLDEALHKLTGFQDIFFSRDFLEPRPLLKAMEQSTGSVLLIDEIDKSDEEFEALLLEVLSDYQVTVPEIGTIAAQVPPLVVLTSNATRELGDALKRRCLHLHIDFPNADLEAQIVRTRVPEVTERLLERLVDFVQAVRGENIRKLPSISETIDWARTLILLHADSLDPALVRSTLNVILKRQSDIAEVAGKVEALLAGGDKAGR